ncbi:hypothetical protein GCM10023085_81730 [Actinomadura viridis]|uniref:DUF4440 domain-containing protein n=1 Tax=Actinomadura viridis TaxID=58110 RepID=A0A931DQ97_9ACTN|nr:DUF4440 domain-containing protein [Actinomadura viridis]MBG6091380.1 hypothetical protein [Actinomadura viridis]
MNAVEEVVRHHRFIEGWLRGTAGAHELNDFLAAHTPDFTWYDPDGALRTLPELGPAMEEAHGAAPDLTLEIREPRVLLDRDGLLVATYEEHHRTPGVSSARRALAVLVPGTLRWRHLHETWIVQPG